MKLQQPPARRYAFVMATIGWTTLIIQLYLSIVNRRVGAPQAVLQFFSYFTVITNIMAALSYTAVALRPAAGGLRSLTRATSLTAVTVYIVMVGIIYNTILIGLADLQGMQLIVDRILHAIVPASFLLFWLLFVPKELLRWTHAFRWLWYPVAYILYVIILGELNGFYPYPFANAATLGYPKAILNGVLVTAGFALLSLLLIGMGKVIAKRKYL